MNIAQASNKKLTAAAVSSGPQTTKATKNNLQFTKATTNTKPQKKKTNNNVSGTTADMSLKKLSSTELCNFVKKNASNNETSTDPQGGSKQSTRKLTDNRTESTKQIDKLKGSFLDNQKSNKGNNKFIDLIGTNEQTNQANTGGLTANQAIMIKQKYSASITGSTSLNKFESLLPASTTAANSKHIVPMNQINLATNAKLEDGQMVQLEGSQSQRTKLNSQTRPVENGLKKKKLTQQQVTGSITKTSSKAEQVNNNPSTPQQIPLKASLILNNNNQNQNGIPLQSVGGTTSKKSATFIEVPQRRTFAQSFHSTGSNSGSGLQLKGLVPANNQNILQSTVSQVKISKVGKFIDLRGNPNAVKNQTSMKHIRTISENQQMAQQFRGSSIASQGVQGQNLANKLDLHRFSLPNNTGGGTDQKGSKIKDNTIATPSKKKLVKTAALTSTNQKSGGYTISDFDAALKMQMGQSKQIDNKKGSQQKIMKIITKLGTNQQTTTKLIGSQTTKGGSLLIPSQSKKMMNNLMPSASTASVMKKNLKTHTHSLTGSAQKERSHKSRLGVNNINKKKQLKELDNDGLPQTMEVDDLYTLESSKLNQNNTGKLQLVSTKKIYSNSVLGLSNGQLLGSWSQSYLQQNPQKKIYSGSLISPNGSFKQKLLLEDGANDTTPRIQGKISALQSQKRIEFTSVEKPPLQQYKGSSTTFVSTPQAAKYSTSKKEPKTETVAFASPNGLATSHYQHKRIESDGSIGVNQYISKVFGNSPMDFKQDMNSSNNTLIQKPMVQGVQPSAKDFQIINRSSSHKKFQMVSPRSASKESLKTTTIEKQTTPLKGSQANLQANNNTQKRETRKKQNFQLFQQTKQKVTTATKKLNDHSAYTLSFVSAGEESQKGQQITKQPPQLNNKTIIPPITAPISSSNTPKANSIMMNKMKFVTSDNKSNSKALLVSELASKQSFSTTMKQQANQNNNPQSTKASTKAYNTAQVSSKSLKAHTPQQMKPQTFKPAQLSIQSQHSGQSPTSKHDGGNDSGSGDLLVIEERIETQDSNVTDQNLTPRTKHLNNLKKKIKISFMQTGSAPDTQIDYYKIGKVMGKGAFGKVNLAIHRFSNKFVALKSINKEFMSEEASKKKVMQEFNILRRARHKNIVRLYESFETPQHIVFVMEVCGGGDLLTYVRKRRKLKEDVARHLFAQIIKGIQYCHQKNVLHRDIKLDNILLTSQGNVKICDFGVSKLVKPDQIMVEQCGTPAYIAPEVFSNDGKGYSGYASDVWSAGVVLYAMLYGAVPFKASNMAELQKQIVVGKPQFKEEISKEALELLKQILEKDPKKRLTTEKILNHPWMIKRKSHSCKTVVFNENEQQAIHSEFEYYNVAKEKPGQGAQGKNGEHIPTDPFADQMLHSTENDLLRNVSTKSIILAPFNSTMSNIQVELTQDQSIKALLVDKKCIKFSAKVKELDRQYELNNNADLDNGVYHQNSKEDQTQQSINRNNTDFNQGTQNKPEALQSHLNDLDDKTPDQLLNELVQENKEGQNSEWKRIEKMIIESQMDEQRHDSIYQMTEEDDPVNGGKTLQIEESYVSEVIKVGYPRAFVYSSLNNDEFNHASMFYYLLTISREF